MLEQQAPEKEVLAFMRRKIERPENETVGLYKPIYELIAIELAHLRRHKYCGNEGKLCLVILPQRFIETLEDLGKSPQPNVRSAEDVLGFLGDLMELWGFVLIEQVPTEVYYSLNDPFDKFSAQRIEPRIRKCREHHREMCSTPKAPINELYLIDCDDLTITKSKEPLEDQYIALSYVWGPGNEHASCCLSCSEDTKTPLPKNLPLLVTDAITVTKDLGFRYLWIDRFCISQDKPETKHRQIMEMDAVYSNSELTVIAAAGQDENYGLPGVSKRSRVATPAVETSGIRVSWFQNPKALVLESRWCSRGWTYQEGFLSRRRLTFLDDQTYFECGETTHYETSTRPTFLDNNFDYFNMGLSNRMNHHAEFFGLFETIILNYTARALRYDTDSLLAFAGILRHLKRSSYGFRHVWGIPWDIATPDNAPPRYYQANDIFISGLCWEHTASSWDSSRQTPRRRPMFPSWTWAGWAGIVDYLLEDYFSEVFVMGPRQFWLEGQGGLLSDVGSVAESEYSEMLRYEILVIETWAVSPDRISYEETQNGRVIWYVHDYQAERLSLSEGAASEAELAKNLKEGRFWGCVLLGRNNERVFLLILKKEESEDTWTRVGVMVLQCNVDLAHELSSEPKEYRIK
ncbi:HET-domain-containing protein [Hypomontagnella monticulosa]|nr:HET-domain-containing protein [Hypomontagnella monticulosa]